MEPSFWQREAQGAVFDPDGEYIRRRERQLAEESRQRLAGGLPVDHDPLPPPRATDAQYNPHHPEADWSGLVAAPRRRKILRGRARETVRSSGRLTRRFPPARARSNAVLRASPSSRAWSPSTAPMRRCSTRGSTLSATTAFEARSRSVCAAPAPHGALSPLPVGSGCGSYAVWYRRVPAGPRNVAHGADVAIVRQPLSLLSTAPTALPHAIRFARDHCSSTQAQMLGEQEAEAPTYDRHVERRHVEASVRVRPIWLHRQAPAPSHRPMHQTSAV